jgi:hypothetical protein
VFEDIFLEFRDDHLYVRHGENFEISQRAMEGFWTFLSEHCARFKCSNVLVEGTAPKRSIDTVGAFTSGVAASSVVPHLWLALCFHDYEPDETSDLFRQSARNRGANVHFFTDCDKALNWLRVNNPHFD